ncbi:FYVE, RhoGEF and PH domain-containing protein 3 isoform X1 [Elephas maximus indicus]|uniref:FYVE, RhoGEF and PH domain-containing protein 3 isoform X1 n=1 Tax=Elephas maximus indicus TaxID=99487 RepID=UPI002116E59C|nr:FYVE, RhoGEF and PH domain-containing protein 3 isoform X1 [Elephas maximus indicus]XP_049751375.1 FYVE, RhoGEF and PH domain-containing protein 3 isoform X1 [Elephas maximus indicus]XP_049751376.1 FYVE, RhoGEF and PH domain-containing protein 3 isoform X1 [Elephas maximus indicus]XP_049751377.1 FYVE, RhoGEF and PH domain-containing protein 3 isoform X1 [Elephas maximus indicus]XP_049751378.1 FYVE, RhoGEF and PH domain-containing protein 3 isoform X1 [Elephas maximus indicus]
MESGAGSSIPSGAVAALGDLDAGPSSSSQEKAKAGKHQPLEPQLTDLRMPQELPICRDHAITSPGMLAAAGDGDGLLDTGPTGEQSGKVPNRDSGIDSPSCSVTGESFPCEESSEARQGPTMLGLHPETDSQNASQDTTSDVDEGSSEAGQGPAILRLHPEADSQDAPQDTTSDVDEGSSEGPDLGTVLQTSDVEAGVAKSTNPQQLFNVARELLHTEEAYVKRLHLLDQVFCTRLTEAGIPVEVTTGIFSNISSIYRFHGQFLLPELQARIAEEWDVNPRLGDILQKLAPFLKMYGEYVKNFDRAMELVGTWTQRSVLFKDIVHDIQKQEVCGNLTLQHHMLEPVQRIPRYELLLKDYLKRLPADAPDWRDAEKSLELISTAANHSNAAIRKMEKMHKLLEVYEQLGGEEDIVNPANELIKEGHIQKLSAKNGTTQDRYLFLFNSMVLYCVPKLRLMGQKFSVREKMDISDLQVQDIVKQNAAHTFVITGRKRSLELQTRTEEEKNEWIQVIRTTIEKHKQNSETFKAFSGPLSWNEDSTLPPEPSVMGASSVEPMVATDGSRGAGRLDSRKSSSKTRREKERQSCKSCGETFNSITKRRHHCKQCSAVICGKCSEFKTENSRQSRVCKECFLTLSADPASPSSEAPTEPKKGTEKPPAADPQDSLLCGTLQLSEDGKAWSEVCASIPRTDPQVLHLQGGSQDGQPPRIVPLPGCKVNAPDPAETPDGRHMLKLHHKHLCLYLDTQAAELQQQWLDALSAAAHGDPALPSLGTPQP